MKAAFTATMAGALGWVAAAAFAPKSAHAQCPASWTLVSGQPPAARITAAVAFDTLRGVAVMFGGVLDGNQLSAETWEWSGTAWRLASTAGPSPRQLHAMAYDSVRRVVVLFGGSSSSSGNLSLGDTWEWNGTVWTRRNVAGPAARAYHAMAYDPLRGRTMLFGGLGSGVTATNPETWEWDGLTWTLRAVGGGPASGAHPVLAFHASRGAVVLTGGSALGLWEWDGIAWVQRSSSGPGFSATYQGAYDALRDRTVVVVRDEFPTYRMRVWEWDGAAWQNNVWNGPAARTGYAMTYDTVRTGVLVYGGADTSNARLADLWTYRGPISSEITGTPVPRRAPAMAYDAGRGVAVLFGGYTHASTADVYFGDTWEWRGGAWMLRATAGPSPRRGAAMTYDSDRGVVVLFGGVSGPNWSHDTWEWNGSSWTQRAITGPVGRLSPILAFDRDRHVSLLLDNGALVSPNSPETWEWNGASWVFRTSTCPGAGSGEMVYDTRRHVAVLCNGPQTWEWNGAAWTNRGIPGPPNSDQVLAFDEARGRTVSFAGRGNFGVPVAETWEYDGVAWTRRLQAGPPGRYGHAMAYDRLRGLTLMFGGYDGATVLGDTWIYRADQRLGDLSGNCQVNSTDQKLMVRILLELPVDPAVLARADLNGDGLVDADDIRAFVASVTGP